MPFFSAILNLFQNNYTSDMRATKDLKTVSKSLLDSKKNLQEDPVITSQAEMKLGRTLRNK